MRRLASNAASHSARASIGFTVAVLVRSWRSRSAFAFARSAADARARRGESDGARRDELVSTTSYGARPESRSAFARARRSPPRPHRRSLEPLLDARGAPARGASRARDGVEAARFEVRAVRLDRVERRRSTPVAARGAARDDRRDPRQPASPLARAERAHVHRLLEVDAAGGRRPGRSALFTTRTSATSSRPAFIAWMPSPAPGQSTTSTVSAAATTSYSAWPTPTVSTRIVVEAERVHHVAGVDRRAREAAVAAAASPSSGCRRPGRACAPPCGCGRRAARRR